MYTKIPFVIKYIFIITISKDFVIVYFILLYSNVLFAFIELLIIMYFQAEITVNKFCFLIN